MKQCVILALVLACCGCTTARGEKIGTITKLAEQGPICPTWEGQLIRGGMSAGTGAFGAPFDFTVPKELVERVRGYMESGTEVKLHYYSYEPVFCSSDSGHFIVSIEPLVTK